MDLTGFAKEQIEKDKGFINSNNFKILKVEENYCELEGMITETSKNPYGILHGGFIFGLADTAAGIAVKTNGRDAVTLNATIDYYKSVNEGKIVAKTNCLKIGKHVAVYEVFVYHDDDLISKMDATYYFLNK